MRRLARALVYDEHLSEDVAQEAARVALGRTAPAGWPAWAWLSGIVRNVARNALRGERRRRAREAAHAVSDRQGAETPLERVARIEAQRRVVDAVLRLEEPYRAVVIGRYFDGASVEELAVRLATPRETVKTRLRRAIERLRHDLDASRSPTAPDWRAAFLPVRAPGPRPRPAPGSSPVPTMVEGIVMKKTLSVAFAMLLGAIGWMGWRLSALSADVERLSHRPEPLTIQGPELASAPALAAPPAATIGRSDPAAADLARRLAALEKRLDALATKAADGGGTPPELAGLVAELLAERAAANETTGIASARNTISAQAQFQVSAKCDADNDGTGEYGGFLEMSGQTAGRMGSSLNPPVLSRAFRSLTPGGEVVRNGYVYRIYLPDARGAGVGEPTDGFTAGMVNADLSETTWCLYAWPVAYGKTGRRTFFTNQGGDVLATDAPAYSGPGTGPSSDAAFKERGRITGVTAIGAVGADGNEWKQVN